MGRGGGGWGRPWPKAPLVAVLGLEARTASLAAGGPRSLRAPEPEINAQSECRRQLPGGLRPGRAPNSPYPSPGHLPPRARRRAATLELRARGPAPAAQPCGRGRPLWAGSRHLPAPCKLWAQGQTESSCRISPARVLSILFLLSRMSPHRSAPNEVRDAAQEPHLPSL